MVNNKPDTRNQMSFLAPDLIDQLNPKHPLLQRANPIHWDVFTSEFAPLYATQGRPAEPIRRMVGLLILKQLHNLSDEQLVATWVQNPYFQAFCGEQQFQWQ